MSAPKLAAVAAFAGVVGWIHARPVNLHRWVPVLDDANLAFHEAGHPVFGIFGDTLGLYGGTLAQLVFPLACCAAFWLRRHAASYAACGVWLAANLFNVARYMADARARELPLAGGGEHDWLHIFARWRALDADLRVAGYVRGLAWLALAAWLAWLAYRWRASYSRADV